MGASSTSHKNKSLRWRELVVLSLQAAGVSGVSMRKQKRLSEAVLEPQTQSDVQGIPGWSLHTRNELRLDLSGSLDEAQRRAEADGTKGAAILFRPRRPAAESFVVISLATFSAILRQEQERER